MMFDFFKLKKALYTLFGASSIAVSGHYGVVVPMLINKKVELIPGSSPLLKKSMSNEISLNSKNRNYRVSDFENSGYVPTLDNSLRVDSFLDRNFENAGFSQDILKHLNLSKQNIPKFNSRAEIWEGIDSDLKIFQRYVRSAENAHHIMSEVEIPNKPSLFLKILHRMDKSDFVQDLVWSLAEESNNKKTIKKQ